MKCKPSILICADYYLPSYNAGGAVRSIANLVERLGHDFDFRVVTRNRDLGGEPFDGGASSNVWQQVGNAQVLYLPRGRTSVWHLRKVLQATSYDALYLNSFFSPRFSIAPVILMFLGMLRRRSIIVAPRGELAPSALGVKGSKKKLYIAFSKALRLYRGVSWHVSDVNEGREVRAIFDDAALRIAGNLSAARGMAHEEGHGSHRGIKKPGVLDAVFLSRICSIKNLDGALQMLRGVRGKVNFTIYGPVEDMVYWKKCQEIADALPANVSVRYAGSVPHHRVAQLLEQYQLFVLPTRGENFGHVIIEALNAGCPILVSDRTPWRNLETSGVGWDVPLEEPERFTEVLQRCVDMGGDELQSLRRRARAYAREHTEDETILQQNRDLFGYCPMRTG